MDGALLLLRDLGSAGIPSPASPTPKSTHLLVALALLGSVALCACVCVCRGVGGMDGEGEERGEEEQHRQPIAPHAAVNQITLSLFAP